MSKKPPQQHKESNDHISNETELLHIPVLLEKVIELLSPKTNETYLDLTAGYGGHARAILAKTGNASKMTLVDRDNFAIQQLESFRELGAKVVHDDFAHFIRSAIAGAKRYNMVLVDLGVSSPQLDKAERGFSLKRNGPLDMRMDQRQEKTAADIVNHASETVLQEIIERYGEEPPGRARAIARAITRARPILTTQVLADVILNTHRGRFQKTHPATRTFQAIRIELNRELEQVETLLKNIPALLEPGGRIAIISFHSLEDRLVKQYFADQANAGYEAELTLLTKKAILGKTDDVHNPRARSAILRVAVKK